MTPRSEPARRRGRARVPRWRDDVDEEHYEAALSYLTLVLPEEVAHLTVNMLRDQTVLTHRRPADLLRAAHLPLLDLTDARVDDELYRVSVGTKLVPILCVRAKRGFHVADGHGRVCAAHHVDPLTPIPLKLVT